MKPTVKPTLAFRAESKLRKKQTPGRLAGKILATEHAGPLREEIRDANSVPVRIAHQGRIVPGWERNSISGW